MIPKEAALARNRRRSIYAPAYFGPIVSWLPALVKAAGHIIGTIIARTLELLEVNLAGRVLNQPVFRTVLCITCVEYSPMDHWVLAWRNSIRGILECRWLTTEPTRFDKRWQHRRQCWPNDSLSDPQNGAFGSVRRIPTQRTSAIAGSRQQDFTFSASTYLSRVRRYSAEFRGFSRKFRQRMEILRLYGGGTQSGSEPLSRCISLLSGKLSDFGLSFLPALARHAARFTVLTSL